MVSAAVPAYTLVGSFPLPQGVQSFDVLNDGRVIGVDGTGAIRVQDALNAGTFTQVGSVGSSIFTGPFGNFGAGFLRVSPDGTRLAIGDNAAFNRVHIVAISALSASGANATTAIDCPNFEGDWADNGTLLVSGFGAGSIVSRVNVAAGSAAPVVTGVGGGSGGVAVAAGRVYIGNGFDTSSGGAPTGNIRSFLVSSLSDVTPQSFLAGTLVADALSGQSLGFDGGGNLLVGGGDFFSGSGDFGYGAIIESAAITGALLGGAAAADSAELRLSPAGAGEAYSILFNDATDEVLVLGGGSAYRYAVPAPGSAAALLLGAALAGRRRRG